MAKSKKTEVIEPNIELAEEMVTEPEIESEIPVEAEAVIEETPIIEEPKQEISDTEKFILAQLKVINKMNNPAKAKRLAERVLRNRKGN